jgi:hypothetical protein
MMTPAGVDHLATKIATEATTQKPSGAAAPTEGDQLRLQEAMQRQGGQDAGRENQQPAATDATNPTAAHGAGQPPRPQEAQNPEDGRIDATKPVDASPGETADAVRERPTMGDAILKGMDHMRGEFQTLQNEAASMSKPQDMSPADLLRVQMQTSRVMLQDQLVGQVAGKADQDVETLLKAQ